MVPPLTYSTRAAIDVASSRNVMGALAALAGDNVKRKRNRMRGQQAARIAHANLRPAPGTLGETRRPCEVPVAFKPERPQRPRLTGPVCPGAALAAGHPRHRRRPRRRVRFRN